MNEISYLNELDKKNEAAINSKNDNETDNKNVNKSNNNEISELNDDDIVNEIKELKAKINEIKLNSEKDNFLINLSQNQQPNRSHTDNNITNHNNNYFTYNTNNIQKYGHKEEGIVPVNNFNTSNFKIDPKLSSIPVTTQQQQQQQPLIQYLESEQANLNCHGIVIQQPLLPVSAPATSNHASALSSSYTNTAATVQSQSTQMHRSNSLKNLPLSFNSNELLVPTRNNNTESSNVSSNLNNNVNNINTKSASTNFNTTNNNYKTSSISNDSIKNLFIDNSTLDPFNDMELKTINDIEELKAILQNSTYLMPSTTSTVPAATTTAIPNNNNNGLIINNSTNHYYNNYPLQYNAISSSSSSVSGITTNPINTKPNFIDNRLAYTDNNAFNLIHSKK